MAAPIILAAICLRSAAFDVAAIAIFVYAMISDVLDGHLARANKQTSAVGSLLDPLADSILFGSLFAGFVYCGWMPIWMFCLVIFREILMHGALRPHLLSAGIVLAAGTAGKIKTVAQFAVGMYILCAMAAVRRMPDYLGPIEKTLRDIAWGLLSAVVAMSIVSMYKYLWDARKLTAVPASRRGAGELPS